ncbi:MAG: hypothetical protein L6Q37_06970 [Bdellovibrionaceae bacterium]|nr:hypothetical protein [Pseudobdellovibrionaceae bacterium]NUM57234.1 hypothetical protein [Pseudobdellovibrionaceae bacterium]
MNNHNENHIISLQKFKSKQLFSIFWLRFFVRTLICTLSAYQLKAEERPLTYVMPKTSKPISSGAKNRQELINNLTLKYRIVKLWPFDDSKSLTDEFLQGPYQMPTKRFNISENYSCRQKTFVRFHEGSSLVYDETENLSEFFDKNKPSSAGIESYFFSKVRVKANEYFPNYVSKSDPDLTFNANPQLLKEHSKKINYSSSLVKTTFIGDNNAKISETNYTVGGWFKAEKSSSSGNVSLLRKKYLNSNGTFPKVEWEIFLLGDRLLFHNYKDYFQSMPLKYLTGEQAATFRQQNNQFYGTYEYYEDVIANLVRIQSLEKRSVITPSPKVIVNDSAPPIIPSQKRLISKPIHNPHPLPLPQPNIPTVPSVNIPPSSIPPVATLPIPITVIPKPMLPPTPIYVSPGFNGKLYTTDLQVFYPHLGYCLNCFPNRPGEQDFWQYISISVHLDDPLGPYVDIYVVRDPNPELTKAPIDFKNNGTHYRMPIPDINVSSLPQLNPFQHGIEVERDCYKNNFDAFNKGSCLKSVLEFGSLDPNRPFKGSMRGVYISKKALNENEVMDLAYEYYPDDKELCTYEKK